MANINQSDLVKTTIYKWLVSYCKKRGDITCRRSTAQLHHAYRDITIRYNGPGCCSHIGIDFDDTIISLRYYRFDRDKGYTVITGADYDMANPADFIKFRRRCYYLIHKSTQ